MESLAFDMGQEGPANGRIQLVAQGETTAATTIDATAASYSLRRFSQGRGFSAYDEAEGTLLRVHLINDVASYG